MILLVPPQPDWLEMEQKTPLSFHTCKTEPSDAAPTYLKDLLFPLDMD